MTQTADRDESVRRQVLRISKLTWLAIVSSLLAVVVGWGAREAAVPSIDGHGLIGTPAVWLVALIPIGYIARGQTYKRHWRVHQITARGYFLGNLLLWGCCAVVGAWGVVHAAGSGPLWSKWFPVLIAGAVLLVNAPNGRPMAPSSPVFDRRDAQANQNTR